jgi:hypothetical protein
VQILQKLIDSLRGLSTECLNVKAGGMCVCVCICMNVYMRVYIYIHKKAKLSLYRSGQALRAPAGRGS